MRTLRDACAADALVWVSCQSCRHYRQMHAVHLLRKIKGMDAPLNVPLSGFFCRRCKRSVKAAVIAIV